MTITNTASRWAYPGNGVTTAFAYTNLIFAASDLKVYLDGVLQTTGYTVSNVGVLTGGNVTFSIPPANHASVVIVRDVPATQDIDYLGNDTFPAATHEKGLDKLTILAQQLAARLPRTLQLADGDPAMSIGGIPAVAERASKYLAFDAEGNPIAASGGPNAPCRPLPRPCWRTPMPRRRAIRSASAAISTPSISARPATAGPTTRRRCRTPTSRPWAVKGTLFIPNGVYLTTGLTLGAATGQYCTIQGESFDTVGGGYGSILRLKAGSNANLISFGALNPGGLNRIMNLTLDGNKANQSNWSSGVFASDVPAPSAGAYYWGIWLKNVRIVNTWASGIYIGRYRGGSYLDNVWMYDCGTGPYHYGLHINNYDVVMNFVNCGNGSGTGVVIQNASQIHGFSVNSYFNAGDGMYIDSTVTDLAMFGCSMDRNQQNGIQVYQNANATYRGSRRLLSGFRFLTNGRAAHNAYSDILCNDATTDVTLIGASFQGSETATKVAYNINMAAGTRFKLFGCKFDTVTPGYGIAAIGRPRLVEGDAPEVGVSPAALPSFAVGALPSAAVAGQLIYVNNGAANKRLAISDGVSWRFPDGALVT